MVLDKLFHIRWVTLATSLSCQTKYNPLFMVGTSHIVDIFLVDIFLVDIYFIYFYHATHPSNNWRHYLFRFRKHYKILVAPPTPLLTQESPAQSRIPDLPPCHVTPSYQSPAPRTIENIKNNTCPLPPQPLPQPQPQPQDGTQPTQEIAPPGHQKGRQGTPGGGPTQTRLHRTRHDTPLRPQHL